MLFHITSKLNIFDTRKYSFSPFVSKKKKSEAPLKHM